MFTDNKCLVHVYELPVQGMFDDAKGEYFNLLTMRGYRYLQ